MPVTGLDMAADGLRASFLAGRDVRFLLLALALAAGGSYGTASALRLCLIQAHWRNRALILAAAIVFGSSAWLTFACFVRGAVPSLNPVREWQLAGQAVAMFAAGGCAAFLLASKARPGYRDLLLAGAVLACSTSSTVFFCLSTLAAPYRLAYGLAPITGTVLFCAILGGLGLVQSGGQREADGQHHGMQRLQGLACLAGIQIVPVVSALAAMLSFADWLDDASQGSGIASEPVAVVMAACGMVILGLALIGSGIDHYVMLQADREASRLRQLVDGAMEGIVIHRQGVVLDANAAFRALSGASADTIQGVAASTLFAPSTGTGMRAGMPWDTDTGEAGAGEAGAGEAGDRHELDLQRGDGSTVPVEVLCRVIDYRGEAAQLLAVRDLRERRAAEAKITHLAYHDGLTGLANRLLLHDRLDHALAQAARVGEVMAVLCLDLDRFKAVNDTLGHAAGDVLLRKVADRLRECVRASDTIARIGGDEFVVVQVNAHQPNGAVTLADRIIEHICAPYDLEGQRASIGTSVGISFYPQDGATAGELMKHADVALYRAKSSGRGRFCAYEPGMDQALREREALERDLREAVGTAQLEMHYQPLVSCGQDEAITGFEALMRWTHPARGAVPPGEFIPLAESCGLIVALGRWALETACREAAGWPGGLRVAVNLSPAQFRADDVPLMVADVLARTGLAADRLELEVTEGLFLRDTAHVLGFLTRLKELGVRLALDDFGTGYSSLGYLRRFPFDRLKIDRSFVKALADDHGARAIVQAILAMSRSLNLDVTAEGVETPQQLALLQEQSCGTVQGFLLGRPMRAAVVPGFLHDAGLQAPPSSRLHPVDADLRSPISCEP